MNTELSYNGYSVQPSDYECPDGDLAMSLNLINEDNHLHPLLPPSTVLSLQAEERVLFIHHTPGQDNYILARPGKNNTTALYWLTKTPSTINTSTATLIDSFQSINDIEAVGNTLILAFDDDLCYILWREDDYVNLGSRPPFISIDTGMTKLANIGESSSTTQIPVDWKYTNKPTQTGGTNGQRDTKADLTAFTQSVFALVNSTVIDKVSANGFFHQPFLLRYAFRLFDGSYAWHSAPILQLPTVIPPMVFIDSIGNADSDGYRPAHLSLNLPIFRLDYRIISDCAEKLSMWKDIIVGIDFFITQPIYTYDQSKEVNLPVSVDSFLRSVTGTNSNLSGQRPGANSTPGNSVDRPSRGDSSATEIFIGHYADSDAGDNLNYLDRFQSLDPSAKAVCANIPIHEKFTDNVKSAHLFYKIAELPMSDIALMDEMKPLPFKTRDITSLVTLPTLPDDYQSHFKKGTKNLYTFNSRLNLGGINLTPPEPFPIRSLMQFGNPSGATVDNAKIRVWTRHNGVACVSTHYASSSDIADFWFNPSENFPRYIFYPDASAYKMQFELSTTNKITINLTPHDFLNGAYYFNPDFQFDTFPASVENETALCALSVPCRSKIYTSEVNNPFLFPVLGINTVGSTDIIAIRSAAKALSQGQFGQFPLYAFTSEGVWALQTNSAGTYSAIQPISRDVCTNPKGITQIDTAVLFPSDRGIMLIGGSEITCISDPINTPYPFDLSKLPALIDIHSSMGGNHTADNCTTIPGFHEFIAGCKMIYDYTHQRIIIFNPAYSMSYIYSLKSHRWGMMQSSITDKVNSYPNALAVDKANQLVDFSTETALPVTALLVSRPVKLSYPNTLKTISNIIQRGFFRNGHVKSLLYGSRDLVNWQLVWTSKDHYLRGFSGTPYKYYRIALVCSLSPDESIFGASVQFNPRLINQPR